MPQTIVHSAARVFYLSIAVHRLQKEMLKLEMAESFGLRLGFGLRIYELQFVASTERERRTSLGAHANPVNARRSGLCSIGFHRHGEAARVKGVNEGYIKLEEWFSTGTYDHWLGPAVERSQPETRNGISEPGG